MLKADQGAGIGVIICADVGIGSDSLDVPSWSLAIVKDAEL
jgi:hypothetical protein